MGISRNNKRVFLISADFIVISYMKQIYKKLEKDNTSSNCQRKQNTKYFVDFIEGLLVEEPSYV
jgi:hypothetical protein